MKKLYKFYLYVGRMGVVESIFAATDKEIKSAFGKQIHFGEILGKHSDISIKLSKAYLEVLTDDQDFISKAETLGLIPFGYNPLDYIYEYEDEDL